MNYYRFRRQHPIGSFIAEFYCHRAKLVIEVYGGYHAVEHPGQNDQNRTHELNLLGIKVIRFSNDQVRYHKEEVLDSIKKHLP